MPLQAHSHIGNRALRGNAQHLREREPRDGVNEGRAASRKCQRDQQVGAPVADHVVDQELGCRGKHETCKPVDEHENEAQRQAAPVGPDQLPGFGPGIREIGLFLGNCHSTLRRNIRVFEASGAGFTESASGT